MTVGDGDSAAGIMPGDSDYIVPFHIETAGARGRLIRADRAVNDILSLHDYPEPVSMLLGEAITLAALLGAALKIDGKFILQTISNGPVNTLVAQYKSSGDLRGYANYDENGIAAAKNGAGQDGAELLGHGHLAMTIEPGAGMDRYQGVVALEGPRLADAADLYFRQSEQIPTFLRIAVARAFTGSGNGKGSHWRWRAGGLLVQKLTGEGGLSQKAGGDDLSWRAPDGDEDWVRARTLAATIEDHELLDPSLSAGSLLYRLFHEERVRAFPATEIQAQCSCSRQRIEELLNSFSMMEREDMTEAGQITVRCEFCNRHYHFDPGSLESEADGA